MVSRSGITIGLVQEYETFSWQGLGATPPQRDPAPGHSYERGPFTRSVLGTIFSHQSELETWLINCFPQSQSGAEIGPSPALPLLLSIHEVQSESTRPDQELSLGDILHSVRADFQATRVQIWRMLEDQFSALLLALGGRCEGLLYRYVGWPNSLPHSH